MFCEQLPRLFGGKTLAPESCSCSQLFPSFENVAVEQVPHFFRVDFSGPVRVKNPEQELGLLRHVAAVKSRRL